MKLGKMLKTGVDKLDKLLGGGLPESSNILIIGPPGEEKMTLAFYFLGEGLSQNQGGIFITTDTAPIEIEKKSGELGIDFFMYSQKGLLKFVDAFSWLLSKTQLQHRPNDIRVPGPAALNELSLGIAKAMVEILKLKSKPRIVFSSLSTLLLYNAPDIVFRFLQIVGSRLKSTEAVTLFIIESEMHDKKIITTLEHLTDGTIEVKKEGNNKMVRILRMSGAKTFSEWMKFEMTKKE